MKKALSILLSALLLASALTGCTGAPEAAPPAAEVVKEPSAVPEETSPVGAPPAVHVVDDGRARPSNSGKLQVAFDRLSDENKNPVMLRGVSLNGLITSEGYLNEECFRELSEDLGVNLIRLAMYTYGVGVVGYCTGGDRDRHKADIALGVELARQYDMYAIIDWHILSDGDPNTYVEEAKEFFAETAERYARYDNVLYEICNEPNGVDWSAVKAYAEQIIPVIREKDPDAVILVGSPDWSKDLRAAAADPLEYDNIMYTLHFYAASHGQDYRDLTAAACRCGLPIFVTEYGITASSGGFPRDTQSADAWIELLEREGVSWCMWSFSAVAEACSALRSSTLKHSGFDESDYTDTGLWLMETLRKHNARTGAGSPAPASGISGDTTWRWEDGVLYIEGAGRMADYTVFSYMYSVSSTAPWFSSEEYKDSWGSTWLEISDDVTYIGACAFCDMWMPNDQEFTFKLPSKLEAVGDYAFFNAHHIYNLTLPGKVKSVGKFAFMDSLDGRIKIPAATVEIGEGAFAAGEWCTGFEVAPGNKSYRSVDGVLFSRDMSVLYSYPEYNAYIENGDQDDDADEDEVYEVPESVREIAPYAFCKSYRCGPGKIILPKGLTSIGEYAFSAVCGDACSIESLTIPDGVTVIKAHTFEGNETLREITLPAGLKEIEAFAFDETSLRTVYFAGTEEQWTQVLVGEENEILQSVEIRFSAA